MNTPVVFLTVPDVLAVHQRMVEQFGGDPGLRDRGLLESAVAMPAARFGGEYLHSGVAEMASAYLFHLCQNHAFVDGNKRTALAAAGVFLLLNDWNLVASADELQRLTLGVAEGTVTKAEVIAFFQTHVGRD